MTEAFQDEKNIPTVSPHALQSFISPALLNDMSNVVKIIIDDMTQNTNFEDEKKGKFWKCEYDRGLSG